VAARSTTRCSWLSPKLRVRKGPLVTADERLMRSLEGESYAGLVLALSKVGELLLFRVAP
jgi:hypothetical protein